MIFAFLTKVYYIYSLVMNKLVEDINKTKEIFFWTMFQKIDMNDANISILIDNINKVHSNYFKVISNTTETLADPFLLKYNDQMYVFFEKINNTRWNRRLGEGTGEIYISRLTDIDGVLTYTEPVLALSINSHLSYPCLIQENDTVYMIPEQRKTGKLDLYECVKFPTKWENVKTLLTGNFSDSTIFYYNNIYWLFTTQAEKKNTKYKENLYYSSTLLNENWKFHSTLKVTDKRHSRRGAGSIFVKNNKIYRPVQNNKDYYGQGILMLEITKLTESEYEETVVGEIGRNIHTINILDNWIVIDSNNKNNNFFIL
jgi:hypothetical protein